MIFYRYILLEKIFQVEYQMKCQLLHYDSDKKFLEKTRSYLEKQGSFQVCSISSLTESLAILESRKFDLVISGQPDGIELLRTLKSLNEPVPFIFFSGPMGEKAVIEALNLGADYFLIKGDEPEAESARLQKIIRDVLIRSKARQADGRDQNPTRQKRVPSEGTPELSDTNTALKEEIAQRKMAESTTKKTLSLLNAALESTADGILVVDKAGKITSYNRKYVNMWDIPDSILESGKRNAIREYVREKLIDPAGYEARINELSEHPERESYDMLELNDGRFFERYSKPQKIGSTVVGRVWNFRDVTDRRQAEENLLASLRDKEVMLREIHHRVKNNLQIISGLLDMTRKRAQDPATISILMDMMMKIDTMAQIHTRLYESKTFNKIDMNTQIRDQISALSNIYSSKDCEISTTIKSSSAYLSVDQAIPCALMVNEILTNAFKHAFKGRERGSIEILAVQEDGHMNITIRDDGVGISRNLDTVHGNSLGFKLIRALIQYQLKGSYMINNDNGTEVVIKFPVQPVSI